MKKTWIWLLALLAAGIAFYTSFRNAIDLAAIATCENGNTLCATVINEQDETELLHLKINYFNEQSALNGKKDENTFPKPFLAFLLNTSGEVIAPLQEPDPQGKVPAIPNCPKSEKYLWIVFPNIKVDGKPAALLIKNPLYGKNHP